MLADGVSFALAPGDALVVRGPNGSGKTTLLRLLAGFAPPAAGRLRLWDDTGDLAPEEAIAWVGHADGMRLEETPRGHLRFYAAREDVAALKALGVTRFAHRPVRTLSAGQRRRAALARAVLSNRPIWLLDEPAAPLDQAGREALAQLVAAHRGRGGVVAAAVHGDLGWSDVQTLSLGAPSG